MEKTSREYAKRIVLEFTKWKDDNYSFKFGVYYWKSERECLAIKMDGKTIEQLFNEWNNLKK